MTTLKMAVPAGARQRLRALHRRLVFSQSVRSLSRLQTGTTPPVELLQKLAYGWNNDGFAAEHEYLVAMCAYAWRAKGPILECGSGLSTIMLGLVAQKTGRMVWSLEHQAPWADRVRSTLRRFDIGSVQLCVAGLRQYGEFDWYDIRSAALPRNFGLIVCDGPPGGTRGGRYGLLPVMGDSLARGAVILLDDLQRSAERDIVAQWAKQLNTTVEIGGSERTYGVLSVH